jgi:uncharacterized protein YukE
MSNIKIKYDTVLNTSKSYEEEKEKLLTIKSEMNEIYERLNEEWKDKSNSNFNNKFKDHIDKLDYFIAFLHNNSILLDKTSNKHKSSEDNLNNNMEKVRDIYEYRD